MESCRILLLGFDFFFPSGNSLNIHSGCSCTSCLLIFMTQCGVNEPWCDWPASVGRCWCSSATNICVWVFVWMQVSIFSGQILQNNHQVLQDKSIGLEGTVKLFPGMNEPTTILIIKWKSYDFATWRCYSLVFELVCCSNISLWFQFSWLWSCISFHAIVHLPSQGSLWCRIL